MQVSEDKLGEKKKKKINKKAHTKQIFQHKH